MRAFTLSNLIVTDGPVNSRMYLYWQEVKINIVAKREDRVKIVVACFAQSEPTYDMK